MLLEHLAVLLETEDRSRRLDVMSTTRVKHD